MKISLNWLREFVDIPADAASLAQSITSIGLAVESREEVDGDTLVELDVTTNRPDCLNHLGVAREVSAIFGTALRRPEFSLHEAGNTASAVVSISIADADLCGRYCGRYIAGVKIGPSPDWLKKRLEALGVRSINNVADVTNYVMLELGQPLHAFDADRLQGRQIVVRRARSGERLTTLDGVDRLLDPSVLVIADASRPVAIAGVMGGGETEISSSTANVLLESAYFQPSSIRKTARTLGMSTEASYRFERGADVEMARFACDRAAAMIQGVAGGGILRELIDVYPQKRTPARVSLRAERIPGVLGAPVDGATVERIFSALELAPVRTAEGWTVEVPSFRVDIAQEEDLLEEIARHHGFDKFAPTLPPTRGFGAALDREAEVRRLRNTLSAAGYSEICTYSFSDEESERRFYPNIEPIRLQNPMSEDAANLRTSLVPVMLKTLQWNLNRSIRNLQFFELGKVYSNAGERRALILAACGNLRPPTLHEASREFDFYSLKGDVEEILQAFGVSRPATSDSIPDYYHPGRFGRVGHLAIFGELHPKYAEGFKFRQRVYLAEIQIDMILSSPEPRQILQIAKHPAIKRDFSLLLDKGTAYAAVRRTIAGADILELIRVEPFDRMESGPFPKDKYSLSVSLVYQSTERTLTDVEVESFDRRILQILESRIGAQLRT